MDVWDCIRTRRSIRKFKDRQVPWDNIIEIMQAGKYAPSAGNLLSYKFLAIKDDGKRKAIAEACMQQFWMEQAPIFIVMVGEPEKMERFYGIRGRRLYLVQSIAACVQNMLLMAHSLGLGACWVGAFDEDVIRLVLNLPEQVDVHAVIPIGYADEDPEMPPKYRIEHMMFFEKWWGRVESPPRTHIGWWSVYNQRMINEGKKLIKKTKSRLSDKVQEKVNEMRESGKGKK